LSVKFTTEAKGLWGSIPLIARKKLLSNVWCPHCTQATIITDYSGDVQGESLILIGSCVTCGGKVVRVVEFESLNS